MKTLSPTAQRVCAVALALLAAVLAWWLLVQWWLLAPLAQISEEQTTLQAAHQRYAALEAQRDNVQRQLAALEQQPLPAGSLLTASSPEAATAQVMQLIVERALPAADSGLACSVVNRLPQTPSPAGGLVRVGVQAELECGIESLAAMLYRLENTTPYLKVDAFEIRRGQPAGPGQERLNVRLQVSGLLASAKEASHD